MRSSWKEKSEVRVYQWGTWPGRGMAGMQLKPSPSPGPDLPCGYRANTEESLTSSFTPFQRSVTKVTQPCPEPLQSVPQGGRHLNIFSLTLSQGTGMNSIYVKVQIRIKSQPLGKQTNKQNSPKQQQQKNTTKNFTHHKQRNEAVTIFKITI